MPNSRSPSGIGMVAAFFGELAAVRYRHCRA
jgi:hypothetical protein